MQKWDKEKTDTQTKKGQRAMRCKLWEQENAQGNKRVWQEAKLHPCVPTVQMTVAGELQPVQREYAQPTDCTCADQQVG